MFTRAILLIFAWALVLGFFVLVYYLWRGTRPLEFYMSLGLMVFTAFSLIFFILRERKRRDEGDKRR